MTRKMLIAGNWKMNGLLADAAEFQAMIDQVSADQFKNHDILICPPTTLLAKFASIAQATGMNVGGEDCHWEMAGAHTGDISAKMLKDSGASYCIVGHSERRANHNETSETVRKKAEAALQAGLIAIVCVGESLAQRQAGDAINAVKSQIQKSLPKGANSNNCVIAYEPVWAIGTGETATSADINQMHGCIRELLQEIGGDKLSKSRILYGGSVKSQNAKDIFSGKDVDGGLIGGASLKAKDFCGIIAGAV